MQKLTPAQQHILKAFPLGKRPNKLGLALELAGISQAEFARDLNFQPPYVSDVVRGRYRTITLENGVKVAEYFGVAVEDLFPAREAVAS